jgi:hypothetical protein
VLALRSAKTAPVTAQQCLLAVEVVVVGLVVVGVVLGGEAA